MAERDWDRLKELYERTRGLSAAERATFVEHACREDPTLRAELEELLEAGEAAEPFFERLAGAVPPIPTGSPGDASVPDSGPDPLLGQRIRQYRIDSKVGAGGMGVVYRAHDTSLDRPVALKFLPAHPGEEAPNRFLVEARAAAALDHPNVCAVYEIGEAETGRPFLAMAFYEGETLKRKLDRGALPVREATGYALQIAAALAAAHARRVVHRDIKPGNVLVTPEGVVKVLDFGLAKLADVSLTRTGGALGTVAYMAPEQLRGESVDARTDLWALGVVWYEMLTGRRPFPGERPAELAYQIRHEEPAAPTALRPLLPVSIDSVMRKALAKAPAARFATAEEFAGALEGCETGSGLPATSVAAGGRRRISRRSILAWAGSAALVALAGFGWLAYGGTAPRPAALASEPAEAIAVVPFTVRGSDLDVWREGMMDLLSTRLDGVGGYRTIDSRTVMVRWNEVTGGDDAAPDLETILRIARRSGAAYVLTGTAVAIGADVRLAADVYDVATGDEIVRGQVEGQRDQVLDLVDGLSVEVMGGLVREGESPLVPGRRVASFTTSSLPALRAYLEGEALYRRSDFLGAAEMFERAVTEDSLFALAHYRLAATVGWIEGGDSERAIRHIEIAARLADRLRSRDRLILAATRARIAGDLTGVELARDAVHRYPDDAEAWYELGEWYVHYGGEVMVELSEADAALSRAAALDPTYPPYYLHLIQAAIIGRDSARAAELLGTLLAMAPESEEGEALSIALPLFLGDSAAHRRALEAAQEADVALLWIIYNNLHPQVGLPSAMEAVARAGRAKTPGRWDPPMIHILADQGKRRELLARAEEARGWGPAYVRWFIHRFIQPLSPEEVERIDAGLDVSACGDSVPFSALCSLVPGTLAADRGQWAAHAAMIGDHRGLADRRRAEGDSTGAEFADLWASWLQAYGDWRRGSADRAIQLLEARQGRAHPGYPRVPIDPWIRWLLGELHVEVGRPDRAARYFESLVHSPLHYSYSRYRLCGLYEDLGEAGKARAACDAFLRAWEHADPDLPQPAEVREALARL